MVKVVWTDSAIQALNDIGEYIAKDSERYAKMVIQHLFESTDLLEYHAKSGRIVSEFNNKNIRELIRGKYRIVYHIVDNSRIDILTVHHAARLLTKSSIKRKV
jgi:addiction module RelE/StbE family toxin